MSVSGASLAPKAMNVTVLKPSIALNRDVLSHICSRLSNDDLRKIASGLGLWNEINAMLRDDLFWKMRAENIGGRYLEHQPDVDWKIEFYRTLISTLVARARSRKTERAS